jgi:uncharacterized membrane protein
VIKCNNDCLHLQQVGRRGQRRRDGKKDLSFHYICLAVKRASSKRKKKKKKKAYVFMIVALIMTKVKLNYFLYVSLSLTIGIKPRDKSKTPCYLIKAAMQSVMSDIKILNVLVEKISSDSISAVTTRTEETVSII